eukprot:CAMPEP_0178448288 /NCGR_PEP_ID=MMETSP0689_2-20121128/41902_1 /TAXON_ID=160604 /ORGANISM="Amphidinium massartii, Strain CS-259" /LENGTH=41 /DNA_ID= /DNA_START= /DNA_END= /DNA_ORIENTATION=
MENSLIAFCTCRSDNLDVVRASSRSSAAVEGASKPPLASAF